MADQLFGIERLIPLGQIVHRRNQRTGGIRQAHAEVVAVVIALGGVLVPGDPPGNDACRAVVPRVRHAEYSEDVLLHEGSVSLAGYLLYYGPQQHIARVAIDEALSGGELGRRLFEHINQLQQRFVLALLVPECRQFSIVFDAGGMR